MTDGQYSYFDPRHDIQAQKLGKNDSFIVQIGAGDVIEKIHNAVSVTITKGESGSGLIVTMGEQR
ncbi:hypothetical protein [Spirosoma panaciterrae]|uniref:hypothetical protein n=1 Tax=Spirosoma panaciterrae TaxID=496058 RepID=UPI00035F6DEB|nr:hypothetical protein [Spirosoma panaciterrae]